VNWLDVLIALIVLVSLVTSVIKGFTRELVTLVSVIAGTLGGLWWYPVIARQIEPYAKNAEVAGFAGFAVIFSVFLLAGWLVSKILSGLMKATGIRWFDRILGAAFGVLRGVLIAAALVLAIVAFTPAKQPITSVRGSRLAPGVLQFAKAMVALAPHRVKDGFQNGLERLRKEWRGAPDDTV
jgi:membrane protein required for colicin V production